MIESKIKKKTPRSFVFFLLKITVIFIGLYFLIILITTNIPDMVIDSLFHGRLGEIAMKQINPSGKLITPEEALKNTEELYNTKIRPEMLNSLKKLKSKEEISDFSTSYDISDLVRAIYEYNLNINQSVWCDPKNIDCESKNVLTQINDSKFFISNLKNSNLLPTTLLPLNSSNPIYFYIFNENRFTLCFKMQSKMFISIQSPEDIFEISDKGMQNIKTGSWYCYNP